MLEPVRYPRPFGKYVLLRQLAVGGMAEVYLARHSGPADFEKECVIKRILPSLAADQQFVNMFLDEARIAARLSHPNIVQIFDLGSIGEGDYFLAMEHVHGIDLSQIEDAEDKRKGRIPLAIAVRICSSVAEGLEHAHRATDARGKPLALVHRDVTPSNVIVSFDGVAKILDFGIAKVAAQNNVKRGRTEVGVIKGKIPYMSPEQVRGDVLDYRSDLFSLGTLLYELTTGRKPFDGEGPADLSIKILNDEPPPPSFYVTHYPTGLAEIVRRAMAKKPSERFQSARELHEALEEFLIQAGIRCTSHDVAAYLESLFPGLREKARHDAGEEQVEAATDPTVPMMTVRGSSAKDKIPLAESEPLVLGELSSSKGSGTFEDARRNLSGGGRGGGSFAVIVLLVLAVAAGFYYLTQHSGSSEGDTAAKPTTTTTATTPTTTAAPAPATSPTANATPTPSPTTPGATTPKPTAAKTPPSAELTPPPQMKEPEAKPPLEPAPKKAAPKPPAHKPPPRATAAHHHDGATTLPRLPTPPPPDDSP